MTFARLSILSVLNLLIISALATSGVVFAKDAKLEPKKIEFGKFDFGVHQFKVTDINGNAKDLEFYKGKVILIVNTASQCGYTPQYKGLQKIYTTYKQKGFEVLGFPSNDFGGQEPGSDKDIKNFSESKYEVTFPMFSKTVVLGTSQSPLFKYLTMEAGKNFAGPIEWNFEKFLIDRQGRLVFRFKSSVDPESVELTSKIEGLLANPK